MRQMLWPCLHVQHERAVVVEQVAVRDEEAYVFHLSWMAWGSSSGARQRLSTRPLQQNLSEWRGRRWISSASLTPLEQAAVH